MAKKQKMFVAFVLDETGSMSAVLDETISGYNKYVDELAAEDAARIRFTMAKFDSSKYELVHDAVKIQDVPHLTRETYMPGAMTPLYDAIARSVSTMQEAVKDVDEPRVCITILTDGLENASCEHTFGSVSKLIDTKQNGGWTFMVLGAKLEAVHMAQGMGIPTGNTSHYNVAHTPMAFAAAGAATRSWASAGGGYSGQALSDVGASGSIGFDEDEDDDSVVPPPNANRAAFFQQPKT